jgi:hypothetical protein
MIIIAIDPGRTCGLAIYDIAEKTMIGSEVDFFDLGDWLNASLHNLKSANVAVLVACERFTIGAATIKRSADAHWALEGIGVARYVTTCYGFDFKLQSPSDAKGFATDGHLRKAEWYIPGKGHANDAIRHAVLALAGLQIAPPWSVTQPTDT